jgi:hypothetical protein
MTVPLVITVTRARVTSICEVRVISVTRALEWRLQTYCL